MLSGLLLVGLNCLGSKAHETKLLTEVETRNKPEAWTDTVKGFEAKTKIKTVTFFEVQFKNKKWAS